MFWRWGQNGPQKRSIALEYQYSEKEANNGDYHSLGILLSALNTVSSYESWQCILAGAIIIPMSHVKEPRHKEMK